MERELRFFPVGNDRPRHLTPEQIARFNERGYIFPLALFDAEETASQRAYFDRLLAMATAAGLDNYAVNGWHNHCRGVYDLVCHPRMLDYVEDIVGPNIICIMTHYFSKNATDSKTVYWHQDAQFWPITPSKVVTAWIAIDDVDEANGAMQLWPGTHQRGIIPFEYVTDEGERGAQRVRAQPGAVRRAGIGGVARRPALVAHRHVAARVAAQPFRAPSLWTDHPLHAA